MNLRRRRLPALVVAVACAVTACGGGDDSASDGERPVDDGEAARLAETLFANLESGSADFELNARLPDGSTIAIDGTVDWAAHEGRGTVTATGLPEAPIVEVAWTQSVVLERIPELTDLAGELGRLSGEWYARGPDLQGRQLDSLIQLVMGLATEQRDNAVLVGQREGTAWLRADRVPDTEIDVDVMRFGPRTVFWVERDGFRLHRFEGNNSEGSRPVVIDLADHGATTVSMPPGDAVIDAAPLADLYEAVTGEIPG